jgi:hypothetical protein
VIVRLLTARVSTDRAGSFNALMKLARRIDGDVEEVVLYEEWKDTASLYGWTGPEVTRPRMMPGAEDLVSDLDIKHYEALDIDPTTFEEI